MHISNCRKELIILHKLRPYMLNYDKVDIFGKQIYFAPKSHTTHTKYQ